MTTMIDEYNDRETYLRRVLKIARPLKQIAMWVFLNSFALSHELMSTITTSSSLGNSRSCGRSTQSSFFLSFCVKCEPMYDFSG